MFGALGNLNKLVNHALSGKFPDPTLAQSGLPQRQNFLAPQLRLGINLNAKQSRRNML
jgi:hypothetical protein